MTVRTQTAYGLVDDTIGDFVRRSPSDGGVYFEGLRNATTWRTPEDAAKYARTIRDQYDLEVVEIKLEARVIDMPREAMTDAEVIEKLCDLVGSHEGALDDYGWDNIEALRERAAEIVARI